MRFSTLSVVIYILIVTSILAKKHKEEMPQSRLLLSPIGSPEIMATLDLLQEDKFQSRLFRKSSSYTESLNVFNFYQEDEFQSILQVLFGFPLCLSGLKLWPIFGAVIGACPGYYFGCTISNAVMSFTGQNVLILLSLLLLKGALMAAGAYVLARYKSLVGGQIGAVFGFMMAESVFKLTSNRERYLNDEYSPFLFITVSIPANIAMGVY